MRAVPGTRGISPGAWLVVGAVGAVGAGPASPLALGAPLGAPLGPHSGAPGPRLTEHDLETIGKTKWLEAVINWLRGFPNDTVDFARPQLRQGIEPIWLPLGLMYGAVVVLGLVLNALALARLCRQSRGPTATSRLLANVCAANLFQGAVVTPLSVVVLMVQNWVFGPVMCYVLPMMQDVPLHVVMLTFGAVAYDRCRYHANPTASPVSPSVVSCCLWIVSWLIVLPYPVYTTYLDLGSLIRDQLHGIGICILNLAEDMQTYVAVAFASVFLMPVLCSLWCHGRVHCLLQRQAASSSCRLQMYEQRQRAASLPGDGSLDPRFPCQMYTLSPLSGPGGTRRSACGGVRGGSLQLEADADLFREQRSQRFLVAMNAVFVVCLSPLMGLRLAKHRIQETYANAGHFDVIFCLFVWFAFLPSVIIPVLISFWASSLPTFRQRLRECFCPGRAGRACRRASCNTVADRGDGPLALAAAGAGRRPASPILPLAGSLAVHTHSHTPRGSRGSLGAPLVAGGAAHGFGHSPDVVPDGGVNGNVSALLCL